MAITLKPEARTIINLLNKFGSLTIGQINKLFEGSNFNPIPTLAFLSKSRLIQFIDDNYAVLENRPNYKPETLYCLWVMLDKIGSTIEDNPNIRNISHSQEITSANPCDNGVEVCFINGSKMIEYVLYVDKTTISKISLIQDTFYTSTGTKPGEEERCKRLYTIVTKDEEIMDTIAEMNLTIPFVIALIEGELTEIPTINYYKMD